jgi:hypothetical protein
MRCQIHQREENSTPISTCLLKDLSMLNLDYAEEDILIFLAETWSSRLQMDAIHNFGGSIKRPKPSRIGKTRDGHSISKVLEDKETCKLGTPTQDGGKCSDTVIL